MEKRAHIEQMARLKELPLKDLLIRMRKTVERTSKLLLAKRGAADVRMEKKLGMMRMALLDRMHRKLKEPIDVDFFMEMIEFINRAEELLEEYEHDVSEWQEFLDMLDKKLQEKGIIVEDEELLEQSRRLRGAVDRLRTKLEGRPPFRPME